MPHLDPGLLELRIHGVRNTPSHLMLGAVPADVERTRGDHLAGFSIDRASDAGHRVEAYSWGRLARFTGFPALGRLGDGLVRAIWFTLAPFGLANTAYWSRHQLGRAPAPSAHGGAGTTSCPLPEMIGEGRLAGTVRVLGLALTLLFVSTAATVALDMAGQGHHGYVRHLLGGWSPAARTVLLTLVPLLAVGVLALLSALARTRYLPAPRGDRREAVQSPGETTAPADDGPPPAAEDVTGHVLARPGLWRAGAGMRLPGLLHGAAALSWTGTVVALARVDPGVATGPAPGPDAVRLPEITWPVLLAVGLGVTAAVGIRILRSQAHAPDARVPAGHRILLGAGALVLLAALGCSLAAGPSPAGSRGGALSTVMVTGVLAALLVLLLLCSRRGVPPQDRAAVAWGGRAPFVFAALSVGFALTLSFSTVILAGWLLGDAGPPVAHLLFSAGFTLVAGAAVAALAVQLARAWRTGSSAAPGERAAVRDRLMADAGPWAEEAVIDIAARAIWTSRRSASLLRRAEVSTAWLAAAVPVGLVCSLALIAVWLADRPGAAAWWPVVRGAGTVGLWTGVALVAVITVLSGRGQSRPAGLLWDLMCFLPTQAHPFGPPCYSERVVPEVADRVEDWLQPRSDSGRRVVLAAHSMGSVLAVCVLFHLSARGLPHDRLQRIGLLSYGSQLRRYFSRFFPQVLGPAVLSVVPAPPSDPGGRDPWPPVMTDEVAAEGRAGWWSGPAMRLRAPGSLWWVLRDRWTNLHRPTDPLGFTVRYGDQAPADGMDVQAEEFVRGAYQFTVATHQGYLESAAYARAFEALVGRLGRPGRSP